MGDNEPDPDPDYGFSTSFPMTSRPAIRLYSSLSGGSHFGDLETLGMPGALTPHPQLASFPDWWRSPEAQAHGPAALIPPVLGLNQTHSTSTVNAIDQVNSASSASSSSSFSSTFSSTFSSSSLTASEQNTTQKSGLPSQNDKTSLNPSKSASRLRNCNRTDKNKYKRDRGQRKESSGSKRKKLRPVESSSNSDSQSGSSSDNETLSSLDPRDLKNEEYEEGENSQPERGQRVVRRRKKVRRKILKTSSCPLGQISSKIPLQVSSLHSTHSLLTSATWDEQGKHTDLIQASGPAGCTTPAAGSLKPSRDSGSPSKPPGLALSPKSRSISSSTRPSSLKTLSRRSMAFKQDLLNLVFPTRRHTNKPLSKTVSSISLHSNLLLSSRLLKAGPQGTEQDSPLALNSTSRFLTSNALNEALVAASGPSFNTPVSLSAKMENFALYSDQITSSSTRRSSSREAESSSKDSDEDEDKNDSLSDTSSNLDSDSDDSDDIDIDDVKCEELSIHYQTVAAPPTLSETPSSTTDLPRSASSQPSHDTPEKPAQPAVTSSTSSVPPTPAGTLKRKRVTDEQALRKPLQYGWRRETFIRTVSEHLHGNVVYYAPCGKKLKQCPDVVKYLLRNSISEVTRDNFSFSPKIKVGNFYEAREGPEGSQWCQLQEDEVLASVSALERQRGLARSLELQGPDGLCRKRKRVSAEEAAEAAEAKAQRRKEAQEIAQRAAEMKLTRKLEKQALAQATKEAKRQQALLVTQDKRQRKEQLKISKRQEKMKLVEQVRMEKDLRAQQLLEEKMRQVEQVRMEKELRAQQLQEEKTKRVEQTRMEKELRAQQQLEEKTKRVEQVRMEKELRAQQQLEEKMRRVEEVRREKELRAQQLQEEKMKRVEQIRTEKELRAQQLQEEKMKRVKQTLMEKELRAQQLQEEKMRRVEQIQTEKELRAQQILEAKQKKKEEAANAKLLDTEKRTKEKEQRREQAITFKHQELEKHRLDMECERRKQHATLLKAVEARMKSEERERRKQQVMLLKAVEARMKSEEREKQRKQATLLKAVEAQKKAEERERLKQEKRDERRLNKERKLELRRLELELVKELNKPNEDMCLINQKVMDFISENELTYILEVLSAVASYLVLKELLALPELSRVPGLLLPGSCVADCLMVIQFLRCFGKVLRLDAALPTLNLLQAGLLNQSPGAAQLQDLLIRLLSAAVCDPGLPPGPRAKTALGEPISSVDINQENVSEILQIFMAAHCGGADLSALAESLRSKPYLAHSPSQKASMLAFVVNELACTKSVVAEIEKNIEHMANQRREKWVIEGKLRKLRILHTKRTGKQDGTTGGEEESQAPGTPTAGRKHKKKADSEDDEDQDDDSDEGEMDEEEDEGGKKDKKTEACEEEDEGDQTASVEELEKQIEKLTKQQLQIRQRLFESSHSLRSMALGQDRYKRRYWVLPQCGSLFVEGTESGEGPLEAGAEMPFSSTSNLKCEADPQQENDLLSLFQQTPDSLSKLSQQKVDGMSPNTPTTPPSSPTNAEPPFLFTTSSQDVKSDLSSPLGPSHLHADQPQLHSALTETDAHWFSLLPRSPCDDSSLTTGNQTSMTSAGSSAPDLALQIKPDLMNPFCHPQTGNVAPKNKDLTSPNPIPEEMLSGWWKVSSSEELRGIVKACHPRGIRERALQKQIQKHMDYLTHVCDKNNEASVIDLSELEQSQVCKEAVQHWRVEEHAMDMDIAVLQQVEELVRKVTRASLQVKNWKPQKPQSARKDLQYHEHKVASNAGIVRRDNNPLDIAVNQLWDLEQNIERRYLKSPLKSALEVSVGTARAPAPAPAASAEGNGGEEDLAPGTKQWRKALSEVRSGAQLSLCLQQLQSSIAWERSTMKGTRDSPLKIKMPPGRKGRAEKPKREKKSSRKRERSEEDTGSSSSSSDPPKKSKTTKKRKAEETDATRRESSPRAKKAKTGRDNNKEVEACRLLLAELRSHRDAWPFMSPVNSKSVPGYRKVIKKPMDFSTIREKLSNSRYQNLETFLIDVNLVFENCEKFNKDDSQIGRAGRRLRNFFQKRWKQLLKQTH